MKRATFEIAALSLAFALVAAAQNAQNPATSPGSQKVAPPIQFSSLDTNKDGRVSKDEVKTHAELTTSFATLDSDKDTYLSETEFGKWHPTPPPVTPNPGAPPAGTSPENGSRSAPAGTTPRSAPGGQ